jgi:hypothetical protein
LQKQSVEIKWRNEKEAEIVPLEGIIEKIKGMIEQN